MNIKLNKNAELTSNSSIKLKTVLIPKDINIVFFRPNLGWSSIYFAM